MKLKYYMRGLGIGIILTTLIFIISGTKEKLTDKEIITRAKAIGMVAEEETDSNLKEVLSELDLTPTPTVTIVPTLKPTIMPTENPTVIPTAKPTALPTAAPTSIPSPEPTKKPSNKPEPTTAPVSKEPVDTKNISFTIKSGMTSGQVAALLVDKGLIEDAEDFNKYIIKVGKASIINVGTFTLPMNASYDDIIKKITSK